MSISIREFKTWAGRNQNAAVAVVDGALADASNQIGVNEGAVKMSGIAPYRAGGWDLSDSIAK